VILKKWNEVSKVVTNETIFDQHKQEEI